MTEDDIHELLATLDDWRTWKRGSGRAAPDALRPEHIAECLRFLLAERQWQPIETAPKDGTFVMIFIGGGEAWCPAIARWNAADNGWGDELNTWTVPGLNDPTHWQPLPAAPIAQVVQPKLNT